MIHLRKGILIISLILISAITFAQVSITVNVPTAGGFSAALTAAGGDANTVTNLIVTGDINAYDISFMNANMPVLAALDLEAVQIKSSGYYTPADYFPRYAFSNKISLTSIKLPFSITVIGSSAFNGCSGLVGDLTIPNTVTSIESNAFYNCSGFNGNLILSNSLKTIGYTSFYGCKGFTGSLIIPESVISIGVGSFMNCIGFSGNLTIPNSVVLIDDNAFNNCTGFNGNLILPNSLITIGAGAFSGCRNLIGNLTIPNSVTSIGSAAFHSCNGFNGLTLSTSLNSISDYVFQNCHGFVGNLVIPNSVTSIGGGAFNLCDGFNGTLTISNSLKEIKHGAFAGCVNLTGPISIPSSVISIGDYAFSQCKKLTGSLSIPNSVKSIGKNAFHNCFSIKGTLVIPSSVDSIGDYAFDGWINMTKILSAGVFPASVGASTFNEMCKKYCQLVVPVGATANYRAADYWKDFVNISEVLYVYFNTNGGTSIADINPTYNSTIAEPIPPTLTGHTFGGWYKDPVFTNPWNFSSDVVTTNTTLYAKWNPNLYTIVFDSQGGSNVTNVSAYYNTTITAPVNPTLAGFTFDGWYKEANCINLWNFDTDVIKDNTVLYAKWVVNVAFDSQGGSSVLSKKTNYNTTISAPTAPTRTGYTFGGWYKETACTNPWNFATDVVTANTTLYAKWTINTYTVTFNSNGGSSVASITAVHNSKISEPTPPTKTGYTFAGWYINLTDDFSFNFNLYMITSNLTLQAKWVPNTYYVTFYSEGTIVDSRGAEYNTTVERPEDPIRTGHIFNGWYKEPTFITLWNFGTNRVTSDMSLYAKWTAITYTVTFNSQGGSPVSSVVVNHGTKVAEPTPPVRDGYTLRGWYDQPTDGFIWFFDYNTVTEDITLYAYWDINSYTISFDSKGGSSVESKIAEYNSTITAPPTPIRTGYTFAGWYKDEALTSAWYFDSDVVTANATLFAKWNVNTYIVYFDSQGGSNINYIEANYGSTITRPADPTKTGYTFVGWFKDQALSNEWNFSTDIVANHMYLYAKWMINSYTVTFNTQGGSAISNVTANYNSTITAPLAPTRTGYTFDGWYKEAGCVNPWVFTSDVVTSDIILYAKWNLSSDVETVLGNNLKLYPNPTVDKLTIEGEKIEEVVVYSIAGFIVRQSVKNIMQDSFTFNVDELKSGIYIAKIRISNNRVFTIRFVKL